ncbi:ABC transporter substrate-binding protein [Pseudobacteriovorax antillogorgiicola]|uniref:Putative spermidine/putrescine transport system substrate-binding protein n=1 Tax=Pseudobacteriovorax antillogorgiicola TaxID=1513793 RepID=A0A1Y6CRB4_9BACT|nr:extracellular solute-binding protein [Pseudobacteriovorax antillogorgiicola]TCS45694.1 putative spermidine/putrescine transport system substrate-binding protein [Pseudobacteriovorax antillogorgiicola]SMF73317.1 putative spermidine/putrescine transport system substrate-binding protein [Pseudobacteriovorax antillogorgiicola]
MSKKPMTRRDVVKSGSQGIMALAVAKSSPMAFAKRTTTLRILGTHVTLQEEIRHRAMTELGINLVFEPMGSAAVLQKASAYPESFDLYEQWSDSINILWQAKAIQSIDRERIQYWPEINPLAKEGRIAPDAKLGKGDAPYKLLYVQPDRSLSSVESNSISFLPYVHNVDSFGYNTNYIPQGIPYQTESWSWLLDPSYRGKVGLVNAPTIGIFDAALAAQARGLVQFKDIGNMTVKEIDQLFEILIEYKRQGHFAGFWNSVPESVNFMTQKRVYIESMFSPGVSAANGRGVPVTYAAPKEGFRAWHGVMCLSSRTEGYEKDAAYEYMNWWLSGWPGAFIARQGYYISNPDRSEELLPKNEWAYWYHGDVATEDFKGTDGRISVKKGSIRDGGSYIKRFSNIAVWNTVMNNYDYSLDKWYEFLSS